MKRLILALPVLLLVAACAQPGPSLQWSPPKDPKREVPQEDGGVGGTGRCEEPAEGGVVGTGCGADENI